MYDLAREFFRPFVMIEIKMYGVVKDRGRRSVLRIVRIEEHRTDC